MIVRMRIDFISCFMVYSEVINIFIIRLLRFYKGIVVLIEMGIWRY